MFRFEVPSQVFFGKNSRLEVLSVLRTAGFHEVGVIIDETLMAQSVFARFLENDLLQADLCNKVTFAARSRQEPDYDYLDMAASHFRGRALQALLGIGGGSTMDLAKGVAILMRNAGRGIDYRGMDKVATPGIPVVLFPTTAGTGSEVTRTASFTDHAGKKKLGINGRHVAAWAGVLDPILTIACPREPTLAAGLDALVHCVESFTAVTSSSLAREMAQSAFPKLFNNLARVIEAPEDLTAREQMMLGAYLAGLAMWNAGGGGPASGVSYPLGALYSVPHGFAGGLLLPHVIRHNVGVGYRGYGPLAESVGALDFVRAFDALFERVGVPGHFGRWGVGAASVPTLVEETMTHRAANLSHNPVPFGRVEVEALLKTVAA